MANLEDLIKMFSESGGVENANPVEAAPLLAQSITRFQKEERAQPYKDELSKLGDIWAKAATPKAQQAVNTKANKVRADYLASGGSPNDLSQELWGNNSAQGFQTGAKQYVPGYTGDNLSLGQKEQIAPLTGMYEGRPTWPANAQQQGLNLQRQGLDNQMANARMDYNASMANLGETSRYHDVQAGQQNLQNKNYIATNTYVGQVLSADTPADAFAYLNQYGSQIARDGADMGAILGAMKTKWPAYFNPSSTLNGTPSNNPYLDKFLPPAGEP